MTDRVGDAVDSLAALPSKVPALWAAAFGDGPREPDSPMGVVVAARVGGDIGTLGMPGLAAAGHVRDAARGLRGTVRKSADPSV
ncbi:hypothetical protein SGRIM128S_00650 [Streptomyces griseomycini]